MLLLAATALERASQLPKSFWVNVVMAVAGVVVLIYLLRHAAEMNRFVLGGIILLVVVVVGFQWVYERNEPKVLTPYIDKIAPFLPSKPAYRE